MVARTVVSIQSIPNPNLLLVPDKAVSNWESSVFHTSVCLCDLYHRITAGREDYASGVEV